MAVYTPFAPNMTGATVGLTASVVMASGAPAAGSATITAFADTTSMLVTNGSSLTAFARICGTPSLTATSADVPVPPTSQRMLACGPGTVYVYAFPSATLGANATMYFTPGMGGGGQT